MFNQENSGILFFNENDGIFVKEMDDQTILAKDGYMYKAYVVTNLREDNGTIFFGHYVDFNHQEEFIEAVVMIEGDFQDAFQLADYMVILLTPFVNFLAEFYDEQYLYAFTESDFLCSAIYLAMASKDDKVCRFVASETKLARMGICLTDYVPISD